MALWSIVVWFLIVVAVLVVLALLVVLGLGIAFYISGAPERANSRPVGTAEWRAEAKRRRRR